MACVLITGARGGVAQVLAQRLAARGDRLVLLSRHPEALNAPGDALCLPADCTDPNQVGEAFAAACTHFGHPPDAVVHAVGSSLIAPLARATPAQVREVFAVNVDSALWVAQAWLAHLKAQPRPGAVVWFSSVVAGMGVAQHPLIAAAKGALEALTRALAADHAASGVRFNCIAPGLLATPMTARLRAHPASAQQIAAQYPLGRHGEAEDAAALAAFLVSAEASWITGQVIGLDGGFSAIRPFVRSG